MRRKWLLCGILCGIVSLSMFGQNAGATNYDKQIKETEKQQKEWENKADSLQKEIEEIRADKDDTLKYIEKLDKKTASLEEELEKLHDKRRGYWNAKYIYICLIWYMIVYLELLYDFNFAIISVDFTNLP